MRSSTGAPGRGQLGRRDRAATASSTTASSTAAQRDHRGVDRERVQPEQPHRRGRRPADGEVAGALRGLGRAAAVDPDHGADQQRVVRPGCRGHQCVQHRRRPGHAGRAQSVPGPGPGTRPAAPRDGVRASSSVSRTANGSPVPRAGDRRGGECGRDQPRRPQPAVQERRQVGHARDEPARDGLLQPARVHVPAARESGVSKGERRQTRPVDREYRLLIAVGTTMSARCCGSWVGHGSEQEVALGHRQLGRPGRVRPARRRCARRTCPGRP